MARKNDIHFLNGFHLVCGSVPVKQKTGHFNTISLGYFVFSIGSAFSLLIFDT